MYSNVTGVELWRKYVKYWQIYQVMYTFVYKHSWLNAYYSSLLHGKRDCAIPVVGKFLKVVAFCVLCGALSFFDGNWALGKLEHWYIGVGKQKGATAFHRMLLPDQFDQITVWKVLSSHYRKKLLAVKQQCEIISTLFNLCEINLYGKLLSKWSLSFFKC